MVRAHLRGPPHRRDPRRLRAARGQDLHGAAACATRCDYFGKLLSFRRRARGRADEGARRDRLAQGRSASAGSPSRSCPIGCCSSRSCARPGCACWARASGRGTILHDVRFFNLYRARPGRPRDRRRVLPGRRVPARPGRGHRARGPGDAGRARAGAHAHERRLRRPSAAARTFPPWRRPVVLRARAASSARASTILPGVTHRPRVVRGRGQRGDRGRAAADARRRACRRASLRTLDVNGRAPEPRARRRPPAARGGSSAFLPVPARASRGPQLLLPRPLAPLLPPAALRARGARARASCATGTRTRTRASRCPAPLGYPLELLQLALADRGRALAAARAPRAAGGARLPAARAATCGCGRSAAGGGALVYALGGFALSDPEPLRLPAGAGLGAPRRLGAAARRRRGPARACALGGARRSGVASSTTGVEIVAQAIADRRSCSPGRADAAALRCACGARSRSALGLAAPVLLAAGGARGRQRARRRLLAGRRARPLGPPVHLLQTVVAGSTATRAAWPNAGGAELLPARLPLRPEPLPGRAVLALARGRPRGTASGAPCGSRSSLWRRSSSPRPLRGLERRRRRTCPRRCARFRFPIKAFFTVHSWWRCSRPGASKRSPRATAAGAPWWRRSRSARADCWSLAPALPRLTAARHGLVPGPLLPPGVRRGRRAPRLFDGITVDAALGGGVAVVLGLIALGARPGRGERSSPGAAWPPGSSRAICCGRAPGSTRWSSPASSASPCRSPRRWPRCGRRASTPASPRARRAYWRGRAARPARHELYTFAVRRDTLAPDYNIDRARPERPQPGHDVAGPARTRAARRASRARASTPPHPCCATRV